LVLQAPSVPISEQDPKKAHPDAATGTITADVDHKVGMTRTQELLALRRRLRAVDRTIRDLQRLQRLDLLCNLEVPESQFGKLIAISPQAKPTGTTHRKRESPAGHITAKILRFPGKRESTRKEGLAPEDAKNA
jgi:hypothetical protein